MSRLCQRKGVLAGGALLSNVNLHLFTPLSECPYPSYGIVALERDKPMQDGKFDTSDDGREFAGFVLIHVYGTRGEDRLGKIISDMPKNHGTSFATGGLVLLTPKVLGYWFVAEEFKALESQDTRDEKITISTSLYEDLMSRSAMCNIQALELNAWGLLVRHYSGIRGLIQFIIDSIFHGLKFPAKGFEKFVRAQQMDVPNSNESAEKEGV
jgi:hypothetical protein